MQADAARRVDVWGGIECSINRIGDRFHNQLELGGHARRIDDIDRVASLGIRTLRYPFLWEQVAPDGDLRSASWEWCDRRADRLRTWGLDPIAGLVHHGSGPRTTGLLDPAFAEGLAAYARAFAERYPWIGAYTPVNEPLTTARFSALYGLWFPHRRSGAEMVRALVNQCRATVCAMRAVREVNPAARLVQTEDLGRIFSTRHLAYQARFENERRWLTWDLLCGRVGREHRLWNYLVGRGIGPGELEWFEANACPPDVLGLNHYVTSNRYLDHRVELFPPELRGGNGRDAYADIEAVRVLHASNPAWGELIRETWDRYRRPIAVTEVHIGCTRDEQLRWLYQAWNAAREARTAGCDVRAITPWALFGSHDWSSLLTRFDGDYEPGAWDVRAPVPRATALAGLIADLASGRTPSAESWLSLPGWWQRTSRLRHPLHSRRGELAAKPAHLLALHPEVRRPRRAGPTLITGATGTMGRALARVCDLRGLPHRLVARHEMDIAAPEAIAAMLDAERPSTLVNAAGYVRVDDAETDRDSCERANAAGATLLAQACARRGIPFVTFSSDLVFDGSANEPYLEDDPTRPLCVYGETKARAERAVLAVHPAALVIRTSAFFGPWDDHNFLAVTLRSLRQGERVLAADDVQVSPTYVPDLAHAALDLLLDRESGLWHLANRGCTTWYRFARTAATMAGVPIDQLEAVSGRHLGWRAPRPVYSVLGSRRGQLMPTLEAAIARFVAETAGNRRPLAA